MLKIKGILLDIDNTLYDYETAHKAALELVLASLVKKYSLDRNTLNQYYEKARVETHVVLSEMAASHNRLLYFQRMFEYLNMNALRYTLDAYNDYWDTFIENIKLHEGVYDFLKSLRGKSICLVSDLTALIQHRKIQRMKLCDYVDFLVTSEEAGREKPHPYIFMLALMKIGLTPADVVMIGDSYEKDITGAVNLGIRSLWFNKKNVKKELHTLVTEFKSFNELTELFEN
jgi:putative hydrolase of the HAD superfamily